ncbi:transporter substrate-binding domain-containing protein [Breoghania sp. L-A4]|uniref:transporter substrate-binding domain-containing protein n=1 Tax=Breoghania sp. L-A4 TaxID=2304600 RepID=UPI0013C33C6C|nr:transporter substrate-binding domain-containing protein [Breoghania sp. L-A4]
MMAHTLSHVREVLAPKGRLRVAINLGNAALAMRDEATGELGGVSVVLARELAGRLGVEADFVTFNGAGKVFAAIDTDEWDIGFLAIDPKRAEKLSFTSPYVIISSSYVVPEASPFRSCAEVDSPGTRIAVAKNAAYDLWLAKHAKHAEIVHNDAPGTSLQMFIDEGLDAGAGVTQVLHRFVAEHPGYRVLPDSFATIEQAMTVPAKNVGAVPFLSAFIEEMKQSGFVRAALDASGRTEVAVAP